MKLTVKRVYIQEAVKDVFFVFINKKLSGYGY